MERFRFTSPHRRQPFDAWGGAVRPGDTVTTEVTYAGSHHLVADLPMLAVRRTRAGPPPDILLGMPRIGAPS